MMTQPTKRKIAWGAIITCFLALLLSAWIVQGNRRNDIVMSRCTDYTDYSLLILDCYGVLSIQNSGEMDRPDYEVFDHKHRHTVAYMKARNDFMVEGEYLYVIDKKPGVSYEETSGKYMYELVLESGEMGALWYDKPDQVPAYLKIATKTGIVTPYQTYDQMSETDRAIFRALETKG